MASYIVGHDFVFFVVLWLESRFFGSSSSFCFSCPHGSTLTDGGGGGGGVPTTVFWANRGAVLRFCW